jgi:DNA primase
MTPEVVEIFDVGYDKESRCITFPVRDIKGNCLFVARRSVVTKFFNYPAGAEKPVYGLYELHQLPKFPSEVIICESMIDAITCWVYGKYAVALNGLGNELQFRQLNAMPCRKFILATDNDDAGQSARKRLRKNIRNKLITEYIFPIDKKDINDLTLEEFNNLEEIF